MIRVPQDPNFPDLILSKRFRQLTTVYQPMVLVAEHGRGPDGWPLLQCLTCGVPIPWIRRSRGMAALPNEYYERRRFCSAACGGSAAFAKIASRSPVDFEQCGPIAAPPPPDLPTRAEITRCKKCLNRVLEDIEVGRRCPLCGQIHYTRDANWIAERRYGSREIEWPHVT